MTSAAGKEQNGRDPAGLRDRQAEGLDDLRPEAETVEAGDDAEIDERQSEHARFVSAAERELADRLAAFAFASQMRDDRLLSSTSAISLPPGRRRDRTRR